MSDIVERLRAPLGVMKCEVSNGPPPENRLERRWLLALEAAARIAQLEAALTPSAETKASYSGEFYLEEEVLDEDGEPRILKIPVPWTTIKEIMAAINARAALGEERT